MELGIFLIGSLGLVAFSWHSLANPRSHGFPRFFAFEAILGLVVLNTPLWFFQPFSLRQLVSWTILLNSAFLAIYAFRVFRQFGEADKSIQDTNRLTFEQTTRLITKGPYRFIRHPMYASLLCLAWGVFLKQITFLSCFLVILASLTLSITAILEERENMHNFGDEYAEYMQKTKRFIPFVF